MDTFIKDFQLKNQTFQEFHLKNIAQFRQVYGSEPQFLAKAPGRVNLIGEHIDYMGYGVLPFALDQSCFIYFSVNGSNLVRINHANSEQFPNDEFVINGEEKRVFKDNYFKYFFAGYNAVIEGSGLQSQKGLNIILSGNVPIASGLSSSASLVICSSLATLMANKLFSHYKREIFLERIIQYERNLGTACGGMDQTVSLLATKNDALLIEFVPTIKAHKARLPSNCVFVIANSLSESPKMNTLGTRYNKRVCECRIGLKMIIKKLNLENSFEKQGLQLFLLQNLLQKTLKEMLEVVRSCIPEKPFTIPEIEILLGETIESFITDVPSYQAVLTENNEFYPFQRLIHVFSEADRVLEFQRILNEEPEGEAKLQVLGSLMNASHQSCKQQYDCSSKELDELTDICRANGAYGSRLTGAGWGGCTVSLVSCDQAEQFISKITALYYNARNLPINQNTIFFTSPGEGASVGPIQY